MLVEKGISLRKYQMVLNTGIAIFFSMTILIPLYSLMHYVILEKSDFRWNSWAGSFSESKSDNKKKGIQNEFFLTNSFLSCENKQVYSLPLPLISKSLVLLEHNPRPDQILIEKACLFGIEGGLEKKLFFNREKIFLDCKNENTFSFSDRETPFWIEVIAEKDGLLEAALHVQFEDDKQDLHYERIQNITFKKQKDLSSQNFTETGVIASIIDYLKMSRVCEADLLIEMYGGDTFTNVKGLYRMYNADIQAPFFIKTGDLFVWREGKIEEAKNTTQGLPLLKVKSLNEHKCEFLLWDAEGLYGKSYQIDIGKASPPLVKPQDVFLKIHQRTDASISCQLYKHNIVLRKGDWLLCSNGKFKNLRSFDEVKDYLRYALKGELFIFDGLVKKDGITSFVGHLFNEERTQTKKVELPLSEKKKQTPLKKKEAKVLPVQVKDE